MSKKVGLSGAPIEHLTELSTKANGLKIQFTRKAMASKSGQTGLSMKDYGQTIKQMAKEG